MNTVLRYPGSKWRIADQLVSNIPEHKSYLEPYFGSGAVLFNKPPSPIETINDLDDDVINLFQCIRDHSQQLAAMIAAIPYSRKVYDSQFSIVSKDPVDKACAFLIKCWQGYGFKTSGIKETRLDGKGPTTYLIGIIFLNGLKKLQNVFETYK